MSEKKMINVTSDLECFRCTKVATVYIPEAKRVLCNDHYEIFDEAYENLKISAVRIDEYLINSIADSLPSKTSANLDAGVPVTLITDHMGQLATGVEPATCNVCGKAMQLHSQWETTKQKFTAATSEGALDPDFLAKFDDEGYCLDCRNSHGVSTGFFLVDQGMSKAQVIAHLNGHDHKKSLEQIDAAPDPSAEESGNVHLMEILGSPIATVSKQRAKELNFPVYVDGNIVFWNPDHRAKQPVNFPIGMESWNGMIFPSFNWFHSFLDHITGEFQAPNSCGTCEGTGQHPELSEPDVMGVFEERRVKAQESSKIEERQNKLQQLIDKSNAPKVGHAGPGIKPHDHRNKKRHYAPRKNGPLGRTGFGKLPITRGPGKAAFVPTDKGKFPALSLFPPVERWWYDQMNMFHDITHTEYKTPSYMYRNPNPMYYSPGSRRNFVSKPWRN